MRRGDEASDLVIPNAGKGSHGPVIAFRTNEEVVIPAVDGIAVWNARTGNLIRKYTQPKGPANGIEVAASADGQWLALGGMDKPARLWESETAQFTSVEVNKGKTKLAFSQRIAISPNSRYLAFCASQDVAVYDLQTKETVWMIPQPPEAKKGRSHPSALAFTPDSTALLIGWRGPDPVITREVITTKTRALCFRLEKGGDPHGIVEFQNGRILVIRGGASGEVKLYDAQMGEIHNFVGHSGAVNGVALSPDERRLVTTGGDGTVRLWDIETGLELFTLGKHTGPGAGVAFSPDGTRIASSATNGTLRIWAAVRPPLAPPPHDVGREPTMP
jgi:WD40 repeat protein